MTFWCHFHVEFLGMIAHSILHKQFLTTTNRGSNNSAMLKLQHPFKLWQCRSLPEIVHNYMLPVNSTSTFAKKNVVSWNFHHSITTFLASTFYTKGLYIEAWLYTYFSNIISSSFICCCCCCSINFFNTSSWAWRCVLKQW